MCCRVIDNFARFGLGDKNEITGASYFAQSLFECSVFYVVCFLQRWPPLASLKWLWTADLGCPAPPGSVASRQIFRSGMMT